jgi:hypothetical protein
VRSARKQDVAVNALGFAMLAAGGSIFGQFGGIPLLLLMFVAMYFLLIAPNQRKQKTWAAMLAALKPGDRVTTNGGIRGDYQREGRFAGDPDGSRRREAGVCEELRGGGYHGRRQQQGVAGARDEHTLSIQALKETREQWARIWPLEQALSSRYC